MLKKMKILLLVLPLIAPLSVQVQAASEDECAIWLCAPSGFRQGCDPAHRAMDIRVHSGQPPLPAFQECAEDDGSMSGEYGYAAYVPAGKRCVHWDYENATCIEYLGWGESWVHNQRCWYDAADGHGWKPSGCTGTARYIEVKQYGQTTGKPYYWDFQRAHL